MRDYLRFLIRHWAMLTFGLVAVFWGNFGQSFFVSWFGTAIQESLQLSATAYGSSYSLATACAGFSIMFVGGWIDRWPLRRFTTVVAIGLLIATGILSISNSIVVLTVGFFFLRLFGQGLLPHTGITTMSRFFNLNRGKAISIAICGVPLGHIVLPVMIVALIGSIGWQHSWQVVGLTIPFIFLPLVWWLLKLEHPPEYLPEEKKDSDRNASLGRRAMLTDYRFWLALPAILAWPFIITGIFIQQGFILEQKGWSPIWFASSFVLYGITHWSSSILAGILIDRWSAIQLLPYFLLPLTIGVFATGYIDGHWPALMLMASFGLTSGSAGTIVSALWPEAYGTRHLGAIRSLVSALGVLATSLSPAMFGVMIDHGISVAQLFTLIGIYSVGSIILICFSYRPPKVLSTG
ncbi:MAG: MFS transporter [Gammaproteobacteria bacterium]|nr:MFS transporter [Gammaproteobacteria bacterium]